MGWPRVRLGDLAERFINGGTPNTKVDQYWQGDIPWITGADVTDDVVVSGRKWITQSAVEESATNIVPEGAILLVTRTGVGKVATAGADIAISQDLTGIVLREGTNTDFVAAALRHQARDLLDIQQGATIKGVLRRDVSNVEIPNPPPRDQRRITEILHQADRLRRLRAEADAKTERVLPALFTKLFGDPASNPMGWHTAPLGDGILETQYGTSKRANTKGQGVPVLRMNNISTSGEMDIDSTKFVDLDPTELERKLLQPGDILFNRTNSVNLVGKTGLWTEDEFPAVAASYLIRVRVNRDKILPSYLWGYLNTAYMKAILAMKARRSAGMANINATELRSLPGMYPPVQCQRQFDAFLSSIGRAKGHRRRSRIIMEQLSECLLSGVLLGHLGTSRDAQDGQTVPEGTKQQASTRARDHRAVRE